MPPMAATSSTQPAASHTQSLSPRGSGAPPAPLARLLPLPRPRPPDAACACAARSRGSAGAAAAVRGWFGQGQTRLGPAGRAPGPRYAWRREPAVRRFTDAIPAARSWWAAARSFSTPPQRPLPRSRAPLPPPRPCPRRPCRRAMPLVDSHAQPHLLELRLYFIIVLGRPLSHLQRLPVRLVRRVLRSAGSRGEEGGRQERQDGSTRAVA
jgi:hypothetical protein